MKKLLLAKKKRFAAFKRLRAIKKKGLHIASPPPKLKFKDLGSDEKLLFGLLAFCLIAILGGVGTVTSMFFAKPVSKHPHHEVAEEKHEEKEKKEGEGSADAFIFDSKQLPDEIVDRQDGIEEPDDDLSDPEVVQNRGIASLMKDGFKINFGQRFVELGEFMAGSKATSTSDGAEVLLDMTFGVGRSETEGEISGRRVELQSLISGIVGERTREQLRTTDGILALKKEIRREVNNVLIKGKVDDVFFGVFLVR